MVECGGYSLVVVCGLLIVVASLVAKHGLQGTWALVTVARGLQSLRHVGSVFEASRLWSTGSGVTVHRFTCQVACGIFPDQG